MNYNLLIDLADITGESGIFEEPVAIDEAKSYLRLEGFIDTTESLSTDFQDDDLLISELIVSARERLEQYTGVSFIPKTWKMEFDNYAGMFYIPNGPVISVTSLEDSSGNLIDDYVLTANNSAIKSPKWGEMVMVYEGGYVNLPRALKEAILKEVAYRYINRGDINVDAISNEAMALAAPFKQSITWLG